MLTYRQYSIHTQVNRKLCQCSFMNLINLFLHSIVCSPTSVGISILQESACGDEIELMCPTSGPFIVLCQPPSASPRGDADACNACWWEPSKISPSSHQRITKTSLDGCLRTLESPYKCYIGRLMSSQVPSSQNNLRIDYPLWQPWCLF